jgi:DNA-binding GntR family transcriptional regulator
LGARGSKSTSPATSLSAVLAPAAPTWLSDTVADRVREMILKGRVLPGQRLREEQLSDALDVSRGPIRHALLQLEREGLVVRHRNRVAVVARLSRADLEEVYSLRLAIEPFVCSWAARNAAARDCADMQSTIDTSSALDLSVTVDEAAEADLRFHDVVYRASGHRRVLRLWQDLRPQAYMFLLARSHLGDEDLRGMIESHGEMLAAIRDGDEARASELAVTHVQTSYRRALSGYADEAVASRGRRSTARREPRD